MKSLLWAAILVLGLLVPKVAGHAPLAVESTYSGGFYRVIASILGLLSGGYGLSLAQLLLSLLPLVLLFLLARALRRAFRLRSCRAGFGPAHRWIMALALLVWSFELLWGLNYARPALAERLALPSVEVDTPRLLRLARRLALEADQAYREALENDELTEERFARPRLRPGPPDAGPSTAGASRFAVGRAALSQHLIASYARLQPRYALLPLSRPKFPSLLGWVMTRLGISGFYFPYSGEASVNGSPPDVAIAFAAAHEMAHQRGTAREDEANFLAYLACRGAELPCIRYSGALGAYDLAAEALWRAVPDSALAFSSQLLASGPRADRAAIRSFWLGHQGPAERAATRVNDTYLKANAQRGGVQSYGRAVQLLAAYDSLLAAGAMTH